MVSFVGFLGYLAFMGLLSAVWALVVARLVELGCSWLSRNRALIEQDAGESLQMIREIAGVRDYSLTGEAARELRAARGWLRGVRADLA